VPILRSRDLRRSAVCYGDLLGFAVFREADCLRIRCSDLDVKLVHTNDCDIISNLSVVFRTGKIRKLHCEFIERALPNLGNLKLNTRGKLQFSLSDPDGNNLYFVEDIA
ncbi:MAG: hypothetical protein K5905_31160, partial [Roseibium sp.]|uniref:hypothetical protein n=1 Tax=Roseibium sp. TaxID=1936156 RepID=UPI00260BDCB5